MKIDTNRAVAIKWWQNLSPEQKDELYKGYTRFTPAQSANQLTGREVQHIWAVETTINESPTSTDTGHTVGESLAERLKEISISQNPTMEGEVTAMQELIDWIPPTKYPWEIKAKATELLAKEAEDKKNEAIAFAEWIPMNAVIAQDGYHYLSLENLEEISVKELYTLFTNTYTKQ